MFKIRFNLFLIFLTTSQIALSQGGISISQTPQVADSTAILDISSNNKGLLIPRMTEQEKLNIQNPALGLIVFNTTTLCLNIFKGGTWFELCGDCIPPAPPQQGSNSPICESGTINLTAASVSGANYYWTGPNGFTSNQQNPTITNATTNASGTYSLIISINGCASPAANINVMINPNPASGFTQNPLSPDINENVTFNPNLTSAVTYDWTFFSGNPSLSNLQNPVVQWTNYGTYDVTLSVVDANNCSATSTQQVVVSSCSGTETFNYSGSIVSWAVPACASQITIEAWGAQGGDWASSPGGYGARMKGTFNVTPGQTLWILSGGKGENATSTATNRSAGGGGGSFVTYGSTYQTSTLLIAAGGGGGAAYEGNISRAHGKTSIDGSPGGVSGTGYTTGTAGTAGNGGGGSNFSGAGAGWFSNGGNSAPSAGSYATGGQSFYNGGAGGLKYAGSPGGDGGFGGGGGAYAGGGGGGGYSGGAGGSFNEAGGSTFNGGYAGGGGSLNLGNNQDNSSGVRLGNGLISISY